MRNQITNFVFCCVYLFFSGVVYAETGLYMQDLSIKDPEAKSSISQITLPAKVTPESSNLTFEEFTTKLKSFNAEISTLQQKQLPFIYKRFCVTNSEPVTPTSNNKVLCGTIYRNANFIMQDANEGNWVIDDLNKSMNYQHFFEKGKFYNFVRAQVFNKTNGYVSLVDIYYAAPDFKVLAWKVPEKFAGQLSWFFSYRNNNTWYVYHVSQTTGFIIGHEELRYQVISKSDLEADYHKILYRSYFQLESHVDLPDSFFLDRIASTFKSYELQALMALFYQLFLPLLWSVFFAWIFMRLVIRHQRISARYSTAIFVFAIMEPFFIGSLFFLISNGAYMEWMIFLSDSVKGFFDTSLKTSLPQIRYAISTFNSIFVVDAVHITISLLIAYPFVRMLVKHHSHRNRS